MSNSKENTAEDLLKKKENLIKGFNYDLIAIENRIGDSLTNIVINNNGVIDPSNIDLQTAKQSLMNARAEEPEAGKPVRSVTSFAETSAEIKRKLNKNSHLFSEKEKQNILDNLEYKSKVLNEKLETSKGIESLILNNLRSTAVSYMNLSNEKKDSLLTSLSQFNITDEFEVNKEKNEKMLSLPPEIIKFLTSDNRNLNSILTPIFEESITQKDVVEPALDLESVSKKVETLIAGGINKDLNKMAKDLKEQIVKASTINITNKEAISNAIKITKNTLSGYNIPYSTIEDKIFRRDLSVAIGKMLPKYKNSKKDTSLHPTQTKRLESEIEKCITLSLEKKIIRDISAKTLSDKDEKQYVQMLSKAKLSIQTLTDPEFKNEFTKLITDEKGNINLTKLNQKTLQNIATGLKEKQEHSKGSKSEIEPTKLSPTKRVVSTKTLQGFDSLDKETSTDPNKITAALQKQAQKIGEKISQFANKFSSAIHHKGSKQNRKEEKTQLL